jgi:hypothetical protein
MPENRISAADTSAMNIKDQTGETPTKFVRTVQSVDQDIPGTKYNNQRYSQFYGYYKTVPELQAVIHRSAIWTLGKGFEADTKTTEKLERIRGNGKDTFNDIMYNMMVQGCIGGDSFSEIITNKRNELRNLKPLNPRFMTILTNEKGIITGYEQMRIDKTVVNTFKMEDIFHLQWNRTGDESHGHSTVEKLEDVILAKNEAMKDMRIVFHRYVKPLILIKADTDDPKEIAALKAKVDNATEKMENMIIPKDTLEMERMSIPQFSTLDPLPWIKVLQDLFILAEGVPEVILGWGAQTTEASAKILYLAWQQNIEHKQRFLEEQLKAQMKLEVEYNFPADLAAHLQGDMRKEGGVGLEGDEPNGRGTDTGTAGGSKAGKPTGPKTPKTR